MGQAPSAARSIRSNSSSRFGIGEDSGSLGPVSVTSKNSTSSRSLKKSISARKRHKQRIGTKQEVRVVEFLPSPFEQPDSKPIEPNNTAERIVHQVLQMYAQQNPRLIADYFTFGAVLEFPGIALDLVGFMELQRQMVTVFPDFHMEYKLVGETSPGVVTMIIQACGTHSGADYATPTCPVPLPAQNARCKNDPEYYIFTFQGGKIKHLNCYPVSPDTRYHGPDGFYQQIVEHDLQLRRRAMKAKLKQSSFQSVSSTCSK
jgi:hypothetical protein